MSIGWYGVCLEIKGSMGECRCSCSVGLAVVYMLYRWLFNVGVCLSEGGGDSSGGKVVEGRKGYRERWGLGGGVRGRGVGLRESQGLRWHQGRLFSLL